MKAKRPEGFPKQVKEGNAKVTIYWQPNPSRSVNPETGKRERTGKVFDSYILAYYQGTKTVTDRKTGQPREVPKLVREKFGDPQDAEIKARSVVNKLANLQGEALKLTNLEALDYADGMRQLHEWKPDVRLSPTITDYVSAKKRLPEDVSLSECVSDYLSRHRVGLPRKTIREVLDEMLEVKASAGISEPYANELRLRLGQFADCFAVPIASVTSKQIQDWLVGRKVSGRTQNNYRRLVSTLVRFAIRRGYLPKDHDEMSGVERVKDSGGEIEIFTPDELRKLFASCLTPVKERRVLRTREEMIPYLAIAAFCGLRAAEIQRLDWSQVHLTGPERFIEVRANIAKTASRRTVPISDNCAAWLAPYAKASGPVAPFERCDKQLFIYLAGKAGVPWKHNGLRHSFISYRLAIIKNVHQVSLEAGNSPQMVFKNYRQLVRESEAAEWFAITPAKQPGAGEIIPMPANPAPAATPEAPQRELTSAVVAG